MFPGRAGGCSHEMASVNIEMPRLLAPDNCVFHSDLWSPHFIGDPGHEALDTGHWTLAEQQHSHSITCPITSLGPSIIFTRVFAGVSSQLPDCHNPADAG